MDRPLTLTLAALGGQGGGVATSWLVAVAERENHLVQATSVPGVAQRTGATIYYLEFHPRQPGGPAPVMGLMPTPGISDLVVASELLEAARMVERGIVNPDRATLIASSHRVYAIGEKSVAGDGRADQDALLKLARSSAKRLVALDMGAIADAQGTLVSAAVLGAIAGAGVLPFPVDAYQAVIRASGISVQANLACFEAAFAAAREDAEATPATLKGSRAFLRKSRDLAVLRRRFDDYPTCLQPTLQLCIERLVDYQDTRYSEEFLHRMNEVLPLDQSSSGYRLCECTARGLALWMGFEDTIRVADLKIRASRLARLKAEAALQPGQVMRVTEFMAPRLEEICGLLPRPIANAMIHSRLAQTLLAPLTGPKKIVTTHVCGYLLLRGLAAMKRFRRRSWRYFQERQAMEAWFHLVKDCAKFDYELACEVADSQSLAAGYGDTLARGKKRLEQVMAYVRSAAGAPEAADRVRAMRTQFLNSSVPAWSGSG